MSNSCYKGVESICEVAETEREYIERMNIDGRERWLSDSMENTIRKQLYRKGELKSW